MTTKKILILTSNLLQKRSNYVRIGTTVSGVPVKAEFCEHRFKKALENYRLYDTIYLVRLEQRGDSLVIAFLGTERGYVQ